LSLNDDGLSDNNSDEAMNYIDEKIEKFVKKIY